MERIVDIYGRIAEDRDWYGRILVNEDNSFEGLASTYDDDEISFVFGNLNDGDISLIQSFRDDRELPKKYRLIKNKDKYKYDGICSSLKDKSVTPYSYCSITLLPAENTREITLYEKLSLANRIKSESLELGDDSKRLYSRFLRKKIADNYQKYHQ